MSARLVAVALLAVVVAACGTDGSDPSEPAPTATTSTTGTIPPPPDTTTTTAASQGGFGAPVKTAGEFAGTAYPVRGALELAGDGCWFLDTGNGRFLVVFPAGFEHASDDPTVMTGPDGLSYTTGTTIDGHASVVFPEELPGGPDGRWGNYRDFCRPDDRRTLVFDAVQPGFDPAILDDDAIEALATGITFTQFFPCGRGWAASTADEMVALFIYQQSETPRDAGTTIALPDDDWRTELVIGKFLFTNHCDDVFEGWEPDRVVAARWTLSTGSIELLDALPTTDPARVRAILRDATVVTSRGTVLELPTTELVNRSFNFFAG